MTCRVSLCLMPAHFAAQKHAPDRSQGGSSWEALACDEPACHSALWEVEGRRAMWRLVSPWAETTFGLFLSLLHVLNCARRATVAAACRARARRSRAEDRSAASEAAASEAADVHLAHLRGTRVRWGNGEHTVAYDDGEELYHVSRIMYHVSCITYHVSRIMSFFSEW